MNKMPLINIRLPISNHITVTSYIYNQHHVSSRQKYPGTYLVYTLCYKTSSHPLIRKEIYFAVTAYSSTGTLSC